MPLTRRRGFGVPFVRLRGVDQGTQIEVSRNDSASIGATTIQRIPGFGNRGSRAIPRGFDDRAGRVDDGAVLALAELVSAGGGRRTRRRGAGRPKAGLGGSEARKDGRRQHALCTLWRRLLEDADDLCEEVRVQRYARPTQVCGIRRRRARSLTHQAEQPKVSAISSGR